MRASSWCSWTTFGSLSSEIRYWTAGLPAPEAIGDGFLKDSGVWGQPFLYGDLAHLVIPRAFFWQTGANEPFANGMKDQDLALLSSELTTAGIPHQITDLVLEIKLY